MADPFDVDPYSDAAMAGKIAPIPDDEDHSRGSDRISYRDAVSQLATFISGQKGGMEMPNVHRGSSNYYCDDRESYWQLGDISGKSLCVVRRSGVRLLTETL